MFVKKRILALLLTLTMLTLAACSGSGTEEPYAQKLNELNATISFDKEQDILSLTIPDGLPSEYSYRILATAVVKSGAGETSISPFEDEIDGNLWVAGNSYSHAFENDTFKGAVIVTAIQSGDTGNVLPNTESITTIRIDKDGEPVTMLSYPISAERELN